MVNTLIIVALIAWILHIALSGWQIHRFNQAMAALGQRGKLAVGRAGGRFKPRVIIAIAFDEQQCVAGGLLMKGITVFARPSPICGIAGWHISELQPEILFPHDRNCQNALSLALK